MDMAFLPPPSYNTYYLFNTNYSNCYYEISYQVIGIDTELLCRNVCCNYCKLVNLKFVQSQVKTAYISFCYHVTTYPYWLVET